MKPITYRVSTDDFTLAPACCIHWPVGDKALLKAWVQAIKKKNVYTFLLGDSLDSARTHFRNHVRSYKDDSNSQLALDEMHKRQLDELVDILRPIKDRIMGTIRGNHYWSFADETNSEQYLCKALGIQYLGVLGVVRILTPSKREVRMIAHHHGGGGGATVGGDANALLKQEAAWDADIYLAGHTHKRLAFKLPTMTITGEEHPQVVERTRVFARTGAFLKGFLLDNPSADRPHFPSYAEEAAYRPTDLGWVEIKVTWREDGRPAFRVEY